MCIGIKVGRGSVWSFCISQALLSRWSGMTDHFYSQQLSDMAFEKSPNLLRCTYTSAARTFACGRFVRRRNNREHSPSPDPPKPQSNPKTDFTPANNQVLKLSSVHKKRMISRDSGTPSAPRCRCCAAEHRVNILCLYPSSIHDRPNI